MRVSVVVATCGEQSWARLGRGRALASAIAQRGHQAFAYHASDATVPGARNLAARGATGDWLCFLDADDELEPGYLGAMERAATCAMLRDPVGTLRRWALLAPSVRYVNPNGSRSGARIPNVSPTGKTRPLEDVNRCVIGTLVPAALFAEVGGFRELPCYEDWDLWLRCADAGAEIVHAPAAVYRAHVREGGRNAGPECLEAYRRVRAERGLA